MLVLEYEIFYFKPIGVKLISITYHKYGKLLSSNEKSQTTLILKEEGVTKLIKILWHISKKCEHKKQKSFNEDISSIIVNTNIWKKVFQILKIISWVADMLYFYLLSLWWCLMIKGKNVCVLLKFLIHRMEPPRSQGGSWN